MKNQIIISVFSILCLSSCEKCGGDPPAPQPVVETLSSKFEIGSTKKITDLGLIEASGIAASQTMDGLLWVNQDGSVDRNVGFDADLVILNQSGEIVKKYQLNSLNRDWEDIAVGLGPIAGKSYLYAADIGDNFNQNQEKYIYRFIEPSNINEALGSPDKITFRYPNNEMPNAEGIIVDPETKDIYIFTKETKTSKVFKLPYPQRTDAVLVAEQVAALNLDSVTGAAISSDGREIIVRTYFQFFYWQRLKKEPISDVVKTAAKNVLYIVDPQGEGVCFDKKNTGYYTINESYQRTEPVYLSYYKRQ